MNRFFINSILFILTIISCASSDTSQGIVVFQNKINGLSFVASKNHVLDETIKPVLEVNANWVALMPFGFVESVTNPNLGYNVKWQWWGEKVSGVKEASKVFSKQGIKRMLKPQIWVRGGAFTGNIEMQSEEEWKVFEKKYEEFILAYAQVAQEEGFEIFCVGTELNKFVVARNSFWENLIAKVRAVYKGKLTYAANWDTYRKPKFWQQLDFIGIDAYFPLSEKKTPSVQELNLAWLPLKQEIKNFSEKNKKPILFTEFGYRSVDYTTKEPWDSNISGAYNVTAQKNALHSIFETFWKEDWFQGGFLWKWFDNQERSGGEGHTGFTVQNKDSELFLKKQFNKQ